MRIDASEQETSALSFVDTLIVEHAHKQDDFVVRLSTDDDDENAFIDISFRIVKNFNEWQEMKRVSVKFARDFMKGNIKDSELVAFAHFDQESVMLCSLFNYFCKDERFNKMVDWFKMAEKLPLWFESVKLQFIMKQANSSMASLNGEIEESKNDS